MSLIEVHGLTKCFRVPVKRPGLVGAVRHLFRPHYEEKLAVNQIDFTIDAGERVGYVGPNGAGKSTTIKMLTGIIVPSAGEARVCGLIPHRQRLANARNISVVFGQRTQLWWDLPVQESLRLLGDIYHVPTDRFARTLSELVELLELAPLLRMPARQLSLGQRMRCDLAAALIHAPRILFLDEPTIGLDVAVKERVRAFVKHLNHERALTVVLTSHDLGDIEDVCTRLVMIDRGQIMFDGALQAIRERFGRDRRMHLVLSEGLPTACDVARTALRGLPPIDVQQSEPYRLTLQFDATDVSVGAVASRLLATLPVTDLQIDEPSIEAIVRQLYQGTLRLQEVRSTSGYT